MTLLTHKIRPRQRRLATLFFVFVVLAFGYALPGSAYASTISGSIYSDEGVTKITTSTTVHLIVNGVSDGTVTTTTGDYSIAAPSLSAGAQVLVYIDNDGTNDGNTVTVSDGNALAGLDIYKDRVIVRHDNAGALTNADMGSAWISDAGDVIYSVDGSNNLTVTGAELFVWTGDTFTPGANVTAVDIAIDGIYNAGSSTITVSRHWDMTDGTFNYGTSTVDFTGTGTITNDNADWWSKRFYNINGAAAGEATDILSGRGIVVGNILTLGTGTVTGGEVLLTKASGSPLVTAGATLSNNRFKYSGLTGPVTVAGTTYPTLWIGGNGSADQYILGGDITCTNLYIYGNGPSDSSQLDTSINDYAITCDLLRVGSPFGPNYYGSLKSNGSVIDINGDLTIYTSDGGGTNSIDADTSSINVSGDWTNSDTFTAGTSTVTIDGTGTQSVTSGGSSFYNLEVTNASNIVTFADALSVTNLTATTASTQLTFTGGTNNIISGTLDLNGQATGTRVVLRSTNTSQYTFDVTGGAQSVSYVDVQYAAASTNDITAINSNNKGNNDDVDTSPFWIFEPDLIVTNTNATGSGSLDWALTTAVANDTIRFDTSVFPFGSPATITPTSALPTIGLGNITVDASDAGVVVDGSSTTSAYGITISSSNNTIMGLKIQGFDNDGIYLSGGTGNTIGGDNTVGDAPSGEGNIIVSNGGNGIYIAGASSSNNIYGNFIGTDGSSALANLSGGMTIYDSASNTIGGTTAGRRNIVSGNTGNGITLTQSGATGNTIQGNYVGTDANGTADLGNSLNGILVTYAAASNTIGGTAPGAGNLISGNNQMGIRIFRVGSDNNVVQGNLIGTDLNGTSDIGNLNGIFLQGGASNNLIGGTTAAERNIISGNSIGVKVNGSTTSDNDITGNYIGTDINGTASLINLWYGIQLLNTGINTTIGGTAPGAGNVISGNAVALRIQNSNNTVMGNYIGVDRTGGVILANSTGIEITGSATNNTIGGTAANAGNIIAGSSTGDGFLHSSSGSNNVYGNYIGTNASFAALPNAGDGIEVTAGTVNLGDGTENQDNVIGANTGLGVNLAGGTINLGGTVDLNDDITLTSGIFNMGSANLNLSGDWDNAGATVNANTSTVTLDGTGQAISGSTAFNDLTKSVTSADTLTFEAGATTTVNGTVTLNGASLELLTLASSTGSSAWYFNLGSGATKAISYVSVSWSDASGSDASKKPIAPANSTDGGDNIDWFALVYQVDSMIKLSSEGDVSYLTDDTYESTVSAQVKSDLVVTGSTAIYTLKFENDGNATDSFVIVGTGDGSGFTVLYLDELSTDRTSAVTGAGYTISSVAAGASKVWTVSVTPLASPTPVAGGTSYDVIVTATSAGDGAKTDQVMGTTTSSSANITLVKDVDKGTANPGEDVTYTVTATNDTGLTDASNVVLTDPIPTNTGLKVGGATFNAGTSTLTAAISYSNDNGSSWIYTPVDSGCSAPTGYDYCVTDVRWTMTGNMPTNTNFNIGLVVRVK